MKVGIIGCGFIADLHAKTIKSLGQELSVVVSRNLEKAKEYARKWEVPNWTNNIETALTQCQVLHICTSPLAHYQAVKKAILAGKHVLCEKPLTISPIEAKELVTLAEQQKVVGAVNFNVRYHDACLEARSLIQNPNFGPIQLIHGHYLQEFHAVHDWYNWRYQPEIGGLMRATTEIGSHWIDLVRFWTGLEMEAVSATFSNQQKQRFLAPNGQWYLEKKEGRKEVRIDSEDVSIITFRLSNQAIGNVVLSEISHGRKNQLQLEVVGKHQSVWWNNENPYQLHKGQKNHNFQTINQPFGGGFSDTFYGLFEDFYQQIKTGKSTFRLPTFKDGLINSEICQAIFESANNQSNWVKISYDA